MLCAQWLWKSVPCHLSPTVVVLTDLFGVAGVGVGGSEPEGEHQGFDLFHPGIDKVGTDTEGRVSY